MVYLIKLIVMRITNYSIDVVDISTFVPPVVVRVSPVADLLVDSLPSCDSSPSKVYRDITYIADNLSKYQNISEFEVASIVERLRSSAPSGAFDKCSDEELFSYMKSRYCQLPSELTAYFNYIDNNIDLIVDDFKHQQEIKDDVFETVDNPAADTSDVVS